MSWLSRESLYTANWMKYGFTPGMGAIGVLRKKLGIGLAQEMLLSARTYRGADLEPPRC
ncbi:MAG TPA: enoyl-CoA hydratase-related protein [Steroidobacteraceae bacterium]|nr:enoyl-CoA hydratase-related protein [Steroidobacteraceae bacterium]